MADNSLGAKTGVPVVLPTISPAWVAYTPTFVGFGTVSSVSFYYRQVVDTIEIEGRFTAGTSTAVAASMTLPGVLTSNAQGAALGVRGNWTRLTNATATQRKEGKVLISATPSNLVQFSSTDYTTAAGPNGALNGNAMASGEVVEISFSVPITEWLLTAYSAYGAGLATSVKSGLVSAQTPQTALTVTGTNWTTVRAVGVAYSDNNGVWRLKFNLAGSVTGAPSATTLTITGVVFKNVANYFQTVTAFGDAAAFGYVIPNTATVACQNVSGTTTAWRLSGDVELDSKPSWA